MSLENIPSFLLNFSEAEMNGVEKHSYRFKSFNLDVGERQLLQNNAPVALTPKAFDVLAYLVERGGHLVEKEELIQSVWPDSFVEEANLARIIHTLRKSLGRDDNGNKFIETVSKKGYRFVAEVTKKNGDQPDKSKNGSFAIYKADLKTPVEDQNNIQPPVAAGRMYLFRWAFALLCIAIVVTIGLGAWDGGIPRALRSQLPVTLSGDASFNYKRGMLLLEHRKSEDQDKALEYFDTAINLDPNFADAYAGKAAVKMWQFASSKAPDDMGQARQLIQQAVELNGSSSYVNLALCRMKVTYDWDFKNGEQACRKAVEFDPNNADAHFELSMIHSMFGRPDEALAEIDAAIALAPTPFNKRNRGLILYYARRYDEAIEQTRQISESELEFRNAVGNIIHSSVMKGDLAGALEALVKKFQNQGMTPETIDALRSRYAAEGWPGALRFSLELAADSPKSMRGSGAVQIAEMYCQLGDFDKAYESLEMGFKQRNIWMVHLSRDPLFDPMQNDPRFQEMLKRIGLK